MNKTILIAGKDAPAGAGFASAAAESGRNSLITVPLESDHTESEGMIKRLAWNRPSPISARSLIVQAENIFGHLDEAVLFFDAQHFAPRFTVADAVCFSRAVDEMMLGYFYLVPELAVRYAKNTLPFDLIFLLKTVKPEEEKPAVPVLTAQAAFAAFAENNALQYAHDESNLRITLVRDDGSPDSEIAAWLFSFLDSGSKKRSVSWVKTGAKPSGVFSFLR